MKNTVWQVKVKDRKPTKDNNKTVTTFTVIEQSPSSDEEFELYLKRQFGEGRIVGFRRMI